RARRRVCARRHGGRKAANPIAIPDGYWREESVCRCLRRLPPSAGTCEGGPTAQTSGNSRRHGRDVPSVNGQPGDQSQENRRPERSEFWNRCPVLSSQSSVGLSFLSLGNWVAENQELRTGPLVTKEMHNFRCI